MAIARDLFPFVSEGDILVTNDGTRYVVSGDEHAGRYFLREGAFDADVTPTEDDSDFARWCSAFAPTDAHEDELWLAVNEIDGRVEFDVDAAVDRAADAWVDQGGERGLTDIDIAAIAAGHSVRPAFVVGRARALGVPVL